jgi:hypothetical protein
LANGHVGASVGTELSFCASSDIFMKDDMDPRVAVPERKFSVRLQKLEDVTPRQRLAKTDLWILHTKILFLVRRCSR